MSQLPLHFVGLNGFGATPSMVEKGRRRVVALFSFIAFVLYVAGAADEDWVAGGLEINWNQVRKGAEARLQPCRVWKRRGAASQRASTSLSSISNVCECVWFRCYHALSPPAPPLLLLPTGRGPHGRA